MYCSEKGVLTVVHVLLDWGAEVDDRWQVQRTVNLRSDFMAFSNDLPLFAAAMNGHGKILNLLLEKTTIDIGPRIDEDYATPLDFALKEGCEGILCIVLEHVIIRHYYGRDAINSAIDHGYSGIVLGLLKSGTVLETAEDVHDEFTLFRWAMECRYYAFVDNLLDIRGMDINSKGSNRSSLLHIAVENGCRRSVMRGC